MLNLRKILMFLAPFKYVIAKEEKGVSLYWSTSGWTADKAKATRVSRGCAEQMMKLESSVRMIDA